MIEQTEWAGHGSADVFKFFIRLIRATLYKRLCHSTPQMSTGVDERKRERGKRRERVDIEIYISQSSVVEPPNQRLEVRDRVVIQRDNASQIKPYCLYQSLGCNIYFTKYGRGRYILFHFYIFPYISISTVWSNQKPDLLKKKNQIIALFQKRNEYLQGVYSLWMKQSQDALS